MKILQDSSVNAVSPGMISTPMVSGHGMGLSEEQVEEFKKSVLNSVPMGTVGNPDEVEGMARLNYSFRDSIISGLLPHNLNALLFPRDRSSSVLACMQHTSASTFTPILDLNP